MSSRRHLDPDNFAEMLAVEIPFEYPIAGEPRLIVFIDPRRSEIGLRVPGGPRPERVDTGLEYVRCRTVLIDGSYFAEVVVNDSRLFTEGYPLLCLIADRIQLQRMAFPKAVIETIRSLGQLLRLPSTLSLEREVGLFGELITLRSLLENVEPEEAVGGWLGHQAEEHDFSLQELDLEVKTTLAERRMHWISSLTQLVATVDKPLWLVSHQLTQTGSGQGNTLRELIKDVCATLAAHPIMMEFERRLHAAGWRDEPAMQSGRRYRARTLSAIYHVNEAFPRLTPDNLGLAGADMSSITEVRYRLDLSNVPEHPAPPPFLRSVFALGGPS